MESQWINEQEVSQAWLVNSSASEQEDVMDWIKSIGVGAAQGAGTGAAAGPWGALIGGLVGGGMGALQQATKPQSAPQQPAPPLPAAPQTSSPPAVQTAQPAVPSPAPSAAVPVPPPSGSRDSAGAIQQFAQLLPQLVQIIQTIQPMVASRQQTTGRAGESVDGDLASLAGDPVPDSAFLEMHETESWRQDETSNEPFELPGRMEPTPPLLTSALPPASLEAQAIGIQQNKVPALTFSGEWSTETESIALPSPSFSWVG